MMKIRISEQGETHFPDLPFRNLRKNASLIVRINCCIIYYRFNLITIHTYAHLLVSLMQIDEKHNVGLKVMGFGTLCSV